MSEGMECGTPVASVSSVSRKSQRVCHSTLGDLAEGLGLPDIPTMIVIGEVTGTGLARRKTNSAHELEHAISAR